MGVGTWAEPLIVISLLSVGCYVNRIPSSRGDGATSTRHKRDDRRDSESNASSPSSAHGLLSPLDAPHVPDWNSRTNAQGRNIRTLRFWGWSRRVATLNTEQFAETWFSRLVVRRIPFIVEVLYWALIYWVYQLGRAFTAVTIVQGTVHTARRHALQLVHVEQSLGIFWEPAIQRFFLQYPTLLRCINRLYSFVHIPATIAYLIALYYFCVTANRADDRSQRERSPAGAALYQARRRTMAMSNLCAFIVFTAWPCMPPRLLSDPNYHGANAVEAKSYGFVDTVHSGRGDQSVWTTNKFQNQYAAMPSLHFGYSLLVGLTVALLPLASDRRHRRISLLGLRVRMLNIRRIICLTVGFGYPALILVAIVATANHFILDAIAGALVCGIAWHSETFLLNLLPLEDLFFWCIRTHKPRVEDHLVVPVLDEKQLMSQETDDLA